MGILSIGGLATGLDTNTIVDQLVALERRRAVGSLQTQKLEAEAHEIALQSFNTRILTLLTAVDKLRDANDVLARKATSSNTDLVTASAANGAAPGATSITVTAVAQGAIATSATGTASVDDTVASGSGSFAFQVGSGSVQSVALDTSTTLQGLATSINELNAGVTATVINIGTESTPDHRLHLATAGTGLSNNLAIITDDTTLGVAVTQGAANASFTISGFAAPLSRETNSFDDVLPGVTLNLLGTGGPTAVTVTTDADATAGLVDDVVKAYNDLVAFVAAESNVEQITDSEDRDVSAGPLAFDRTVDSILDSLRANVSDPVSGLPGAYSILAQLGVDTQQDGTLAFDQVEFKEALASDEAALSQLLGGTGGVDGVADRLHDYLSGVTQAGGLIEISTGSLSDRITSLEDRILAGERNLDQFEDSLRASFVSLEVLVSSLQTQGAFLQSFFGTNQNSNGNGR